MPANLKIHSLTDGLADTPKAMLVPSFVNLLHLDDEEIDPDSDGNINFDIEYVRMIFYIAHHSDTFFDGRLCAFHAI